MSSHSDTPDSVRNADLFSKLTNRPNARNTSSQPGEDAQGGWASGTLRRNAQRAKDALFPANESGATLKSRLANAYEFMVGPRAHAPDAEGMDAKTFVAAAWRDVRHHVVLVIVFSAAINLLYLSPSLFMLQVYDRVLPSSGVLTLLFLGLVLIVALATMSLLDAARSKLLARASLRLERLGAGAIMREMLAARRNGAPTGNVAGVRDLDTLRQGLSSPAAIGLIDLPWTPLFIFVCFVIHFWIGVLALGGAFVILALALLNERSSRKALTTIAAKSHQFHTAHEGDLVAAETGYALGAETALMRRRLDTREDLINAQMDSALATSNYSAVTKFTRQVLQSASLGLGAYLAIERQISPGAIIACSILTARAYAPVEQIVGGWRQVGLAYAAFGNIQRLLAGGQARIERTPLPPPTGHLRLEGVYATAPGAMAPAISNINLTASPGELIAVIGASGAGKTALARVLANATPPRAGTIRIDGARYADWDPQALSAHIGYMPQKIDLYDGTVADNISCFARVAGVAADTVGKQVVEAAMMAGSHELILSLPNGYETALGPNGVGLSQGQSQRIALARALYGSPRIMVLDEPNSHLDSEGELALSQALQRCKDKGVLCFVIAHRSGIINIVDRILVMARGQVAMFGPREEVLASLSGVQIENRAPADAQGRSGQ